MHPNIIVWLCALLLLITNNFVDQKAMAQPLAIGNNDVVSLSNLPELLIAKANVDAAGRPSLSVTLRFANKCLLDAGVTVETLSTSDGNAILLLKQSIPAEGCADIYSPIDWRAIILFPANFVEKFVTIIARPWKGWPLEKHQFVGSSKSQTSHDALLEITHASTQANVPTMHDIVIEPLESNPGYRVVAQLDLDPTCSQNQLALRAFEISNERGEQFGDMLLVSSPSSCRSNKIARPIEINIQLPLQNTVHTIFLINDVKNKELSVPR